MVPHVTRIALVPLCRIGPQQHLGVAKCQVWSLTTLGGQGSVRPKKPRE